MRSFFAYPSSQQEVVKVIRAAKEQIVTSGAQLNIQLWEENEICGRPLTSPIFEGIKEADFLIADVTSLNFNVTFEIGYAIGLGKRVYLTRNSNFRRTGDLIDKIGIFDTLGFQSYADQADLRKLISGFDGSNPIPLRTILNVRSPVYLLRTPQSNSSELAIISRIKKARLGFRAYMPSDVRGSRLRRLSTMCRRASGRSSRCCRSSSPMLKS
ncbi:hypothetical protein [Ensifer aridi]|uniref:hypothetical protein n=1 Tax=Ensifer aridi TaxID=1708715 RepID=UPI000A103F2D|nr:hypothetical protein [Ensifer aridi]